jgi:hypothetical protein
MEKLSVDEVMNLVARYGDAREHGLDGDVFAEPIRTHLEQIQETHEPEPFQGWQVDVRLMPDGVDECIVVTIRGIDHYLHSTSAMVLFNRLGAKIRQWNRYAEPRGAGVSFTDLDLR